MSVAWLDVGHLDRASVPVVLAAGAMAVRGSHQWLAWAGTLLASGGVLLVEPWVHRRWYSEPQ